MMFVLFLLVFILAMFMLVYVTQSAQGAEEIIITSTLVGSNYTDWKLTASGSGGEASITDATSVAINGGNNINVTRTGSSITINSEIVPGIVDTNASTACTGGEVLFGNGTCGVPSGSGTVTSVGSGTGLQGGPITSSGTISLNLTYTDARYNGSGLTLADVYNQGFITIDQDTLNTTGFPEFAGANLTANTDINNKNITEIQCLVFESGGKICTGS